MKLKTKKVLLKILLLLFIIVFIVSAVKIIKTLYDGHKIKNEPIKFVKEYIPKSKGTFTTIKNLDIDFDKLIKHNSDTIGWIQIPDTTLNYPILYKKNDNLTYLNHNFEKKYAQTGSIFLEGANSPDFQDPVTFVYGHNVSTTLTFGTQTYFTCLADFSDPEYAKNHPTTIVKTPKGKTLEYKNLGILRVHEQTPLYKTRFANDKEYENFQKDLSKQLKLSKNPFKKESKILMLATCLLPQENITERILLVAYR